MWSIGFWVRSYFSNVATKGKGVSILIWRFNLCSTCCHLCVMPLISLNIFFGYPLCLNFFISIFWLCLHGAGFSAFFNNRIISLMAMLPWNCVGMCDEPMGKEQMFVSLLFVVFIYVYLDIYVYRYLHVLHKINSYHWLVTIHSNSTRVGTSMSGK